MTDGDSTSEAQGSSGQSGQDASKALEQRAIEAIIGSGAQEFPMDVQMASMEPAGGADPAAAPATQPATPTATPDPSGDNS